MVRRINVTLGKWRSAFEPRKLPEHWGLSCLSSVLGVHVIKENTRVYVEAHVTCLHTNGTLLNEYASHT